MNAWLGIMAVMAVFIGTLAALRVYGDRDDVHPEVVRKLLHVSMGLVTLSFPWLFNAIWPVALLCLGVVATMALVRYVPALRERTGAVIHGVGRDSIGEFCFPVAVLLLFILAGDQPVMYAIPILLLVLADPVAALIGLRHGTLHYETTDGLKSSEGSISFFFVAFLCTHIPLLLFTATGRLETLLIALIVAFLMMLVEGLAWHGLDNFFVPIGGYVLLQAHVDLGAAILGLQLFVLIIIFAAAFFWRTETTLNGSAVLCAALLGWVIWAMGGWPWLLAPAVLFFSYALLWPADDASSEEAHSTYHVLSVASVGMLWLFLAVALGMDGLLLPYTLAFTGYLALIGVERQRAQEGDARPGRIWVDAAAKSAMVLMVTYFVVVGFAGTPVLSAILIVASATIAAGVYLRYTDLLDGYASDFTSRVSRAALIGLTSSIGLLPLLLAG